MKKGDKGHKDKRLDSNRRAPETERSEAKQKQIRKQMLGLKDDPKLHNPQKIEAITGPPHPALLSKVRERERIARIARMGEKDIDSISASPKPSVRTSSPNSRGLKRSMERKSEDETEHVEAKRTRPSLCTRTPKPCMPAPDSAHGVRVPPELDLKQRQICGESSWGTGKKVFRHHKQQRSVSEVLTT